jgi:hypothetical protein
MLLLLHVRAARRALLLRACARVAREYQLYFFYTASCMRARVACARVSYKFYFFPRGVQMGPISVSEVTRSHRKNYHTDWFCMVAFHSE